jgi:SAM-dependent methyltransferase
MSFTGRFPSTAHPMSYDITEAKVTQIAGYSDTRLRSGPGADLTVMLDLSVLAPNLERRAPGLWFADRQGAVSYPAQGNARCLAVEDNSFWFRHRNRCIVSLVGRHRPEGVFLDVGGGNGFVSQGLELMGIRCALVEPGMEGALAAHARGIDPVICGRLEDVRLPPTSFAAAGMFDVLEHIEDETGALRRIHTLLAPGGRLFLTVPAYQMLYSTDDEAAGHFRRYSSKSLTRTLRNAGFVEEQVTYIFWPLVLPILLFRTFPSLMGLKKGSDPERVSAEHAPAGQTARLMSWLLDAEYRVITRGRRVPLGSSLLAVATKL